MKKIGLMGLCLIMLNGISFGHIGNKQYKKSFDEIVDTLHFLEDGNRSVLMDYTRPLAEMIKANGFDWVNNNITEKHFPITKRPNGEVETKMFHFNRPIDSDEAIREMEKEGYRPAELPELLAYAKNNPDEQRKYPIVILGSVWRRWSGGRSVPCLCGDGVERVLNLLWRDDGWGSGYFGFLAVRKS